MALNILDWIKVGQVSAERDENLVHYFFDAGVSKSLVGNKKQFLLLGRKGAGKSALFEYLKAKPKNLFQDEALIVPLSLTSYNWNAHFLLADPQKGASAAQRDSWRLVIAIESIRVLFNNDGKRHSNSLNEANDLLEKLFSKPIPKWTDLLGEKLFGLSRVKLPSGNIDPANTSGAVDLGEVSFDQLKESNDLKSQLSRNITSLTDYLERKLREAMGDGSAIYLIFDRLDEAWLESNISECKQVITGLINAAEHALQFYGSKIRPILFLREDIFGTLDLNDKNKLKEDCGSVLMWTSETLMDMLEARLKFYASNAGIECPRREELFDRKSMRSRATPLHYILNRTFYRPRDVVAFFNKIIESARGIENAHPYQLATDAIYDSEPSYSEYIYNELVDEWQTQLRDISSYLDVIENIGTSIIPVSTLEKQFEEKLGLNDRAKFRSVLRFLFENSIIGFRVGASTQWRYKCAFTHQGFLDVEEYKIHPALKRRLGLKDSVQTNESDE